MRRILIVDDEAGFTRMLKLNLESGGNFIVQEENDGRKALETARSFLPDMIFLDVVMPDIDGGDVAAQLKADPRLSKIPIVFLTAIVGEKEAGREAMIGGFPFLAKPVTVQKLIQCVDEHTAMRPV